MSLNNPISSSDLLQAVERMPTTELDEFAGKVLSILAHRKAPAATHKETQLLWQINTPIPRDVLSRYRELIALRRAERLTKAEQGELLQLGERIEAIHLQRMTNLVELARLRNVSLDTVMRDLGIQPEPYE